MNARLTVCVAIVLFCPVNASAGPKSKMARETAEYLFNKGSKELVEHGVEAFARKVESLAVRHGDDVFLAVKSVGAKALPMIETHGSKAAKILGKHGEHGAVWVVERPSAMNLVAKHGDDVASVLVRHPGAIAEPLLHRVGHSAINAFSGLGPQSGRRLAMLAEGETAHLAANPKVLDVISRFGEAGMSFVWRHKATLAVSAALVAFLADPEPFISGAKDITKVVGETAIKPLAEVPGKAIEAAAQHAMPNVAKQTNWTIVILLGMALFGGLVGMRLFMRRAPCTTR